MQFRGGAEALQIRRLLCRTRVMILVSRSCCRLEYGVKGFAGAWREVAPINYYYYYRTQRYASGHVRPLVRWRYSSLCYCFRSLAAQTSMDRSSALYSLYRSGPSIFGHENRTQATDPSWKSIWPRMTGWKLELMVQGAQHYSFSDLSFLVEVFWAAEYQRS
jgi:hypothetical protein